MTIDTIYKKDYIFLVINNGISIVFRKWESIKV